tara:strand:+ start:911 stop:1192 length:282 start_codon:yes stop_codon:yes gene_type:complete
MSRFKIQEMIEMIDKSIQTLEQLKEELQRNEKDLLKFYKRGSKRAGVRVRRLLKRFIDNAQTIRLDIYRLYKERDIFKGTEFDKDYKRDKTST